MGFNVVLWTVAGGANSGAAAGSQGHAIAVDAPTIQQDCRDDDYSYEES